MVPSRSSVAASDIILSSNRFSPTCSKIARLIWLVRAGDGAGCEEAANGHDRRPRSAPQAARPARRARRADRPGRHRALLRGLAAALSRPHAGGAAPGDDAEVADAVRLCAAAGVPIVPQGGNTSMVGGAAVSEDGSQIVLSLSRLNRVRGIDPVDMTMEIEAGVTLEGGAGGRGRCRLPVAAVDQLGGLGADRRRARDQCRRQQHGALRQCARSRARARSRACRRAGVERAAAAAQGQYRLLPAPAVRRQRGHARHHHRRGAEALSRSRARPRWRCARSPRPRRRSICSTDCSSTIRRRSRPIEYMSGAGVDLVLQHIPGATLPFATRRRHYVLVELATPREGARSARLARSGARRRRWRRGSSPTR